jgi:hypothetical protein
LSNKIAGLIEYIFQDRISILLWILRKILDIQYTWV